MYTYVCIDIITITQHRNILEYADDKKQQKIIVEM